MVLIDEERKKNRRGFFSWALQLYLLGSWCRDFCVVVDGEQVA